MITFEQFRAEWEGHRVGDDSLVASGEESNNTKYQCVSLIKQYVRECYELSPGFWGNALQWWTATNPQLLTKFNKDPSGNVQKGDIAIFRTVGHTDFAGYGHIGIATGQGDPNSIEVLEQNGSGSGTGLGSDAIRTRFIARNRLAGVLRPIPVYINPIRSYQPTSEKIWLTNLQPTNWWNMNNTTMDINSFHPAAQLDANTEFRVGGYAHHINNETYAMAPEDFNRAVNGDLSTNNGVNIKDLREKPIPIVNPIPTVINTPTPTVPVAEKYTLVTTLVYFPTAEDAKQRTPKALGPVFEGTYYVVGKDAQAVKLSKDNKTDIGWINTNDNRLPILEPVIMAPTLPVDPPKVVTEPVNVNPAPIVDIAPAQKDIPWNWLNADHSPTVYRYKGTMPVPIRDLEGTKPPLTMNAGLQGPISRFTEIQGRTYLIPDSEFKKGNAYGIPQQLMAPLHPNILQEAEGDVLKFWESFEDLPKKVYTLISDISPVKRHEVIYKGRQFIDGFKKGSKK